MWHTDDWNKKEYELLDASGGQRLESWGGYILIRPDPQIIWNTPKTHPAWQRPSAEYVRTSTGGGHWENNNLPESWRIKYRDMTFAVKPMNFKHTGVFPEQAVNWNFMREIISKTDKPVSVLNLFAYTGGATIACALAGADVCHVDAAKGMVAWAKENAEMSGVKSAVRYIVDDCKKFIEREIRRGNKYDAIIMDPPSYGRGPNGEIWKLEDQIYSLVELCKNIFSNNPLFFIINSYSTGLSPSATAYILKAVLDGQVAADEIGIKVSSSGMYLPCGSTARWSPE